MKKRVISMALAAVLALGLSAPAMAYTTPDFSDLPANNWAYAPVMRMADAGVIKGTGNGTFSPEMKVSAAQFLTLVGRVVFPEVKAEGADWFGPYVTAAQNAGLLTGTQVDVTKPEAEISRYDMAVILRGAVKQMGLKETTAEASQVTDFGDIPNRYTDAVLAVYGTGLITGDQNGNFNGTNTMMRNETATVLDRLIALPEAQAKAEAEKKAQEEKEAQEWYESSRTGNYVTFTVHGSISASPAGSLPGAPVGIFYKDGRLLGETVSDEDGRFRLEVTVDEADFNTTDKVYYAALTGWYEFEGKHYNTTPLSRRPKHELGLGTATGYVLSCSAYAYETDPERFPDVDPSNFK